MRDGGPSELKLERFMEAVYCNDTSLSYHALIGTQKQSVSDVEQIFSAGVLAFMERVFLKSTSKQEIYCIASYLGTTQRVKLIKNRVFTNYSQLCHFLVCDFITSLH